jgi:hypothetical protein
MLGCDFSNPVHTVENPAFHSLFRRHPFALRVFHLYWWAGPALGNTSVNAARHGRALCRENARNGYHFTGVPISSGHTFVCGKSFNNFASSSGFPVSAGNVPKCIGITFFALSSRQASPASRGPMV